MLEPEVKSVLRLPLVERQTLRIGRAERAAGARRRWIEPVARSGVVRLQAGAEGKVGRRQHGDGFHEIGPERVLGEIVAMNRRIIEMQAAVRAEARVVE